MTILWRGAEDCDFTPYNSGFIPSANTGMWSPNSATGWARTGYGRHALVLQSYSVMNCFIRNTAAFSSGSFWVSARTNCQGTQFGIIPTAALVPIRFVDSSGIVRLQIRFNGTGTPPAAPFLVEKINAGGTATQLGSASAFNFANLNAWASGGPPLTVPDKMDFFINYAVSGQFSVYSNGTLVFDYTGDITTNSVTSLAYIDFGQTISGSTFGGSTALNGWSEMFASTTDTRTMSLCTRAAVANGNTDTWTSGTAGGVNTALSNDAAPNFSATAAQIQEYTVTAIPTGLSILDVAQVARVTVGASGPAHIELGNRIAGTEYFSSDLAPNLGWGLQIYSTTISPATSAAYTASELNGGTYNLAMKSTA